jgi:hypothetical protein
MNLLRRRTNGKGLAISTPDQLAHIDHGSHDEITQKLEGLPAEWIHILRENGVIGEDLVLVKKTKSNGVYSNGVFNSSRSSFLSNRSLQKLWKGMAKRGSQNLGDSIGSVKTDSPRADVETPSASTQGSLSMSRNEIPTSPLDCAPSNNSGVLSPTLLRESTLDRFPESNISVDLIAQECGLPFRHKDYQDVNPNFVQVVDSLGHGSLGVVEEVRVSPNYPSFVRKRVQIPYNKRKQYLRIISQEAQALRSLTHCHIVKMIGSYSEVPASGRQFYSLLMAPVGQRDLKTFLDIVGDQSSAQSQDWIEDRRTWLRNWFKCLSSALAYMHSKGVRHQDIKPSNIIHRRSAIYFTDFSSASQFDVGQTTSTENPARTSAMYAAPEVINNSGSLNRHGRGTDVFALGAVFTEILAVVRGYSIEEFHRFLLDPQEGYNSSRVRPVTPAGRKSFLYGRKLNEIAAFFQDDEFYQTCVAPMLNTDREKRFDAEQVATGIRSFVPWILRGCACDTSTP